MTDEHRDTLMLNRSKLVHNMELKDSVLNELMSSKVLRSDDVEIIKRNNASLSERVERFLDIFPRKPDSSYDCLVRILAKHEQPHIVAVLDPGFDTNIIL